jgi:uncharacterized protein YdcH (DUF465 family)
MEDYERVQIESLVPEDEELRGLWSQHLDFERRLEQLDALPHLTPEEEIERKRIQKLKLAGKDRIAGILARHRREA